MPDCSHLAQSRDARSSASVSFKFMDPYQILGISRACTLDEVKKAFRAKAWLAHPDRGGENESFIRLCNAYEEILKECNRSPRPGVRTTPKSRP